MTRALLRVVLALALAWASLAVALARGEAGGVAVICSGGGLLAVPLDADGRPEGHPGGPAKACPDGILAFAAAPAAPPLPARALRLAPVEPPALAAAAAREAPRPVPRARGPPPPA